MTEPKLTSTAQVLNEVYSERMAQDEKWGEQNHPNGTGDPYYVAWSERYRKTCDSAFNRGVGTWRDILLEEFYEALAEEDPEKLRNELIQVAAVSVAWVECIDRDAA